MQRHIGTFVVFCAAAIAPAAAVFCCTSRPAKVPTAASVATATGAAPATQPASLAGTWSGNANIVVQFVQQKRLAVRLVIAEDGSVSGSVGDATLVDAKLRPGRGGVQRSLGWGREYRIHGRLSGNLVAAENVRRDAVDILLDPASDGTLVGGLHSSGSKVGGKEKVIVSAGDLALRREAQAATAP